MGTEAYAAFAAYPGIRRLQTYTEKSKYIGFLRSGFLPVRNEDKVFGCPALSFSYAASSPEIRDGGLGWRATLQINQGGFEQLAENLDAFTSEELALIEWLCDECAAACEDVSRSMGYEVVEAFLGDTPHIFEQYKLAVATGSERDLRNLFVPSSTQVFYDRDDEHYALHIGTPDELDEMNGSLLVSFKADAEGFHALARAIPDMPPQVVHTLEAACGLALAKS